MEDPPYTGHHTKLYQPDTHPLFGFRCYGDFCKDLNFRISRNQEAKVFSSEGDSVVTFHDTSETVVELPGWAEIGRRNGIENQS